MKKHLFCVTLLAAFLLTGCGSTVSQENVTSYNIDALTESDALTDADKQRQYFAYLENYLQEDVLMPLSEVSNAAVTLYSPTDADTAGNSDEEISASVMLELQDELSSHTPAQLAQVVATAVGNASTDEIVIMDIDGNLLFPEE